MKQNLIVFASAALILVACGSNEKKDDNKKETISSETSATEPTASIPPLGTDSVAMAEMMKAWQDFSTPGSEHAWMAKSAGSWVCDSVKQWMDPSQPPSTSKATEVVTMAMNGLYQMTDFSTTMMNMPMKGHGIMGYDKMKKKYVLAWIDNLGSGIVRMEGNYNESGKTLNMMGKQSDPGRKMETDIRQEIKYNDDGSFTMSMYGTGPDGKSEQKFMEGTFKKAKK